MSRGLCMTHWRGGDCELPGVVVLFVRVEFVCRFFSHFSPPSGGFVGPPHYTFPLPVQTTTTHRSCPRHHVRPHLLSASTGSGQGFLNINRATHKELGKSSSARWLASSHRSQFLHPVPDHVGPATSSSDPSALPDPTGQAETRRKAGGRRSTTKASPGPSTPAKSHPLPSPPGGIIIITQPLANTPTDRFRLGTRDRLLHLRHASLDTQCPAPKGRPRLIWTARRLDNRQGKEDRVPEAAA